MVLFSLEYELYFIVGTIHDIFVSGTCYSLIPCLSLCYICEKIKIQLNMHLALRFNFIQVNMACIIISNSDFVVVYILLS